MSTIIDFVLHGGFNLCRSAVPSSVYSPLYLSLVCGADLPAGREKALFLDTGLIHIMVVSGAHLVFVESLVSWLPARVRLCVVGVYCWLTGWGAPVVRAFVRRACSLVVGPWGWSPLQVELLASLVVLLLVPWWLGSRSFLMAWMCALALQAPGGLVPRGGVTLNTSLKVWLLLFPFVPASWIGILWNTLLGPVVGCVLFPLCVAAFLAGGAASALGFGADVGALVVACVDQVWFLLLWVLNAGPRVAPGDAWVSVAWVWWLPLGVHLLLLWGELKWRRAFAFSVS